MRVASVFSLTAGFSRVSWKEVGEVVAGDVGARGYGELALVLDD